jgi:hypothetical protein
VKGINLAMYDDVVIVPKEKSEQKNTLVMVIVIVIAILSILGAGYYLWFRKDYN